MDSTTNMDSTAFVEEHLNEILDAQSYLWSYIYSYHNSMALKCSLELGIPDAIHKHGKPITLPELASALHIHPTKVSSLNRVMRLLVHSNIFSKKLINGEFTFDLTQNSQILLKDHPFSLASYTLAVLNPSMIEASHSLSMWLKNDSQSPFHVAHGRSLWEHAGIVPEFNEPFNHSMACDSGLVARLLGVNKEFKGLFEGVKSLVDVGGGDGTMAKAIAEAYPEIKCVVLDLPHVVGDLQGNGLNLVYVGGNMFEAVPPAQVALLKWILHNWNDEHCIKILQKCKEAIPSKQDGGKVIIIDMIMEEHSTTKILMDMEMMSVCVDGKERTKQEWQHLFRRAGFSDEYKVLPILGLRPVIQIYPL